MEQWAESVEQGVASTLIIYILPGVRFQYLTSPFSDA
jgi:hypothetical protein